MFLQSYLIYAHTYANFYPETHWLGNCIGMCIDHVAMLYVHRDHVAMLKQSLSLSITVLELFWTWNLVLVELELATPPEISAIPTNIPLDSCNIYFLSYSFFISDHLRAFILGHSCQKHGPVAQSGLRRWQRSCWGTNQHKIYFTNRIHNQLCYAISFVFEHHRWDQ